MNAYTELKEKFNHLERRTLQLFDYGQKQEHKLKEAVVNAWNQFGKIAEMDNISDIKDRALIAQKFMSDVLKSIDTNKYDSLDKQPVEVEFPEGEKPYWIDGLQGKLNLNLKAKLDHIAVHMS